MQPKPLPDITILRQLMRLDDSGVLLWNPRTGNDGSTDYFNQTFANKPVGTCVRKKPNSTHVTYSVTVQNSRYPLGRIAFKLAYGRDPKPGALIDHIDRNTANNRPDNLREVTPTQNAWNLSLKSNNAAQLKGVGTEIRNPRTENVRYRATIRVHGRRVYLGAYKTPEEAAAAYKAASILVHGDYSIFATDAE